MSIKTEKPMTMTEQLRKKFGEFHIGRILVMNREDLELTQAAMAKKIGISRGNLCDLEKGRKHLSLERALEFAKFFGIQEQHMTELWLQLEVRRAKLPYKVKIELKAD